MLGVDETCRNPLFINSCGVMHYQCNANIMLLAPVMEIVGKVVRLTDGHLPGVKNRRGCVQEPVYPLHRTSASPSEEETVDTKRIFQL